MDQRGSAAEPVNSSLPPMDTPVARVQSWAGVAARIGAGTVIPHQDLAA